MSEKVSVIVPIYKVEKYLNRCVESIVNQTYTNLEIILVNDGSPDACPALCEEWASKDARIIVIHKENGGVSSARNAGLDRCSGEYITFADPDDYLHLEMIETLVRKKQPEADIVICNFTSICNNSIQYKATLTNYLYNLSSYCDIFWQIDSKSPLNSPWNKLYRQAIIISNNLLFPHGIKIGEDIIFNINYLENCNYIQTISDSLYYYVYNSNSATSTLSENTFFLLTDLITCKESFATTHRTISTDNEQQLYLRTYADSYLHSIYQLTVIKNSLSHAERITQLKLYGKSEIMQKVLKGIDKSFFKCNQKMKLLLFLTRSNLYSVIYWIFYVGHNVKKK